MELSRSIKHIWTKTFQNGDISYNNGGGGGAGTQIQRRPTKKRVNSELMSLCNLQCHYEDEGMPEEDKNMTDNEDVSPGYS